ncbi:sigma-54 dependent transcriptional regulator [Paucibacter sp. APW11]|uniref:Sigma-54 dependent transcriptional regulator n=1 Tax=Roseateles aquae TaxID=3077235 RepID=A0ABU3PE33_9BURK|nr:sigma-54 dependent transcriptional regulator [Paucibacter sp. APW11]MDT9000166.1 sigma-54 dependent transcriptional regulator [Paucibacter sp. APW11]
MSGSTAQEARPGPGNGRAVLIIDDEATLARNVATYLERLGWATQVAGSAEQGLDCYTEFRPDVVLLDHNLPGLSGLEALGRLRSIDPQACVVLMTGFGGIELAVAAMKQGAVDYLAKPLALGELKLLLERLLTQSRLESTVDYYRSREAESSGLDKLLGRSAPIVALRDRIGMLLGAERQLTDGDVPTVLILGETGTGKELVARALHFGGPRAAQPFVELNCGALQQQLLESELFGYEKGAFTDARQRKLGLVETAEGGTLFLDEIAEADASTQLKLLKLLEDRRYRRLGSVREQQGNVRIIGATHQPLEQMVREGRFRADLYFRLRIVEIHVPPLRERGDDVLFLARHFLAWHAQRYRRPVPELSAEAEGLLMRHRWPGNVRELRHAMEQALLMAQGAPLTQRELAFLAFDGLAMPATAAAEPPVGAAPADEDLNLERSERRLIMTALQRCGDNVTQAAKLLGISRDTLRYRMERLQLRGEG